MTGHLREKRSPLSEPRGSLTAPVGATARGFSGPCIWLVSVRSKQAREADKQTGDSEMIFPAETQLSNFLGGRPECLIGKLITSGDSAASRSWGISGPCALKCRESGLRCFDPACPAVQSSEEEAYPHPPR